MIVRLGRKRVTAKDHDHMHQMLAKQSDCRRLKVSSCIYKTNIDVSPYYNVDTKIANHALTHAIIWIITSVHRS